MEPTFAYSSYFKAFEKLGSSFKGKINLTVFAADCWSSTLLLIFFLIIYRHISALRGFCLLRVTTTWYPTLNLSVINSRFPTMISFPLDRMAIRLDNYYASSRWCVVRMMDLFSLYMDFNMPQMACLEFGSRPELGSSRNMSLDPPIRLFARQSFLLFPPDKLAASLPLSLPKAHC